MKNETLKKNGKMLLETLYKKSGFPLNDSIIKGVLDNYKNGIVMMSERMNKVFEGILYELDDEVKGIIEEVEASSENTQVCHVIKMHMEYGTEYTLILCPENEDEIKSLAASDTTPIEGGYCIFAKVVNPHCGEFGDVGIIAKNGGFARVW